MRFTMKAFACRGGYCPEVKADQQVAAQSTLPSRRTAGEILRQTRTSMKNINGWYAKKR